LVRGGGNPDRPQGETHPTFNIPIPLGWLKLSWSRLETAGTAAETEIVRNEHGVAEKKVWMRRFSMREPRLAELYFGGGSYPTENNS
jgi:hypothetical protein